MKNFFKFLGSFLKKFGKLLFFYILAVSIIIAVVMNRKAKNYRDSKAAQKLDSYDDELALVDDINDGYRIRLELLRKANESLDICYYLYDNSNTATVILDEIVKAADRGVKVRLILNNFNSSFRAGESWRREILSNHPNIEFYYYQNPYYNFYKIQDINHDKVIIADETYLLTGGRNIADRFYIKDDEMVDDLDICVKRKSKKSSIDNYMAYYEELLNVKPVKKVSPTDTDYDELRGKLESALDEIDEAFFKPGEVIDRLKFRDVKMTFVHNGLNKTVKEPKIMYELGELLEKSESVTWLSPYIISTRPVRSLGNFNKEEKKIDFITNSSKTTPNFPGFGATLAYKRRTARYGDIYSYVGKGSIHTKAAIFDDGITAIGSFNLDPRSAFLSTETMAIVDSQDFQDDLNKYVESRKTTTWDEASKEDVPIGKTIALFIVRIFMYVFSPLV